MTIKKLYTQEELDKKAKSEVRKILKMESELMQVQKQLNLNPEFRKFIDTQKKVQEQTDAFWAKIKEQMIASGVKNIKGDWGYITIGETFSYSVTDISKVPEEFTFEDIDVDALREDIDKLDDKYKTTGVDIAAIKEDVSLTDEVPDGVEQKVAYKLMKKIKPLNELEA
jgi:hypothetical protein